MWFSLESTVTYIGETIIAERFVMKEQVTESSTKCTALSKYWGYDQMQFVLFFFKKLNILLHVKNTELFY